MTVSLIRRALFAAAIAGTTAVALAAPDQYIIDPTHTYPSFEADHLGGLSIWRGKFNLTSGKITMDKQAQAGTIDVKIEMNSVDFGFDKMNTHAMSPDMLDVQKYPSATYTGKLVAFKDGAPTAAEGTLNMHGVSKPVKLTIDRFLCKKNPRSGKDVCGADASATFNRDDFGISYGKDYGFNMGVNLKISVEAVKADGKTE